VRRGREGDGREKEGGKGKEDREGRKGMAGPIPNLLLRVCSLSVLTAIFPGKPGSDGYIGAKNDGGGGDNWSYKTCKAPVKSSPPTNQHPALYSLDALPVTQPTVSKHCQTGEQLQPSVSGNLFIVHISNE